MHGIVHGAANGILVLDKPSGMSSATVVERVRLALGASRAGHGGTLDPIATGVLVICLGAGTKLARFLIADDKAYVADGVLGVETDTLDRTGRVVAERPAAVTRDALIAALAARLGEQTQIPPMYSAVKIGGVRLYDRARAGEDVERAPRPIRIDRLELLAFEPPRFRIAVACSKGTYIRSLVADVGTAVGAGAHLAELRRVRSGRFAIEQAVALDRLDGAAPDLAAVGALIVPPAQALDLARVAVPATHVATVLSGVQLPVSTWCTEAKQFQMVDEQGRLLAVAHDEAGRTVYDRVFPELARASGSTPPGA